ncbi:12269_t:CDS:1 [Funneliformis geosporum]|uniref:6274_t:CDS:1 n=1 Tax=Funneliformis geosporum TaxID=1117311 RepID=A0A9W4SFG4_9GLOM|nr:6274_t:CDS:1 [Funneliformis geosporum]CAI2181335.1 12269_t:CDS:1 [Funneliformis geosporum]
MTKLKKRSTNAFFQYRNSKIVHEQKRRMRDHSRITASGWKSQDDSQKVQFFQAAAKDAVEKEAASGGNGFTNKSFEPCGNFAFINETPIKKERIPPLAKKESNVRLITCNEQSIQVQEHSDVDEQRDINKNVISRTQVPLKNSLVDNKKVPIDVSKDSNKMSIVQLIQQSDTDGLRQ